MDDSEGIEVDMRTQKAPDVEPSVPFFINPPEPEVKSPPKKLSKARQAELALEQLEHLERMETPGAYQKYINKAVANPNRVKGTTISGAIDRRMQGEHLFKAGDKKTIAAARKGGLKGRVPKFREILTQKMEEHADDFVRPFIEGVKLREDPTWAPSTKLRFLSEQAALAEKAFDRLEGTPVQRNRNVDKDDNDLTTEVLTGINKDAGIEMLAAIFSAVDSVEFEENMIEAEVVEEIEDDE